MKKTSPINLMVEPHIKQKLKAKAETAGLNLTGFFEKVANEEIVFFDNDLKKVASLFQLIKYPKPRRKKKRGKKK